MSLARFSVRNPVPVNLLMLAILIVGSVSFISLPRELMSDISFNWAFIIKPYPGVTAEEIEKLITVPIENEIRDVKGIDFIASQSSEGSCFISVKFKQMSDEVFRARMSDLRAEVDKVKDLPEDTMDTMINTLGSSDIMPQISVHLYGALPEKEMLELSRQLRDELLQIPKIAKVERMGIRDREVWVEADPAKLKGYLLSPHLLQQAIQSHGVNVPAGRITVGRKEMLVRSVGEFGKPDEIKKVIIRSTADGRTVRVGDVAKVSDTFARARTRSRLDGEPVITISITKQNDGNSISIIDEVKRISREFAARHPNQVGVGFTTDSSEHIRDMLGKLSNNALMGLVVVLVMLLVVLGFRNAILAALGIPISFLACFIFMYWTGESFNGNSLLGLVLVLGIVVDDAIMIVENCYRHLQDGKSWKQAAIDGTDEIMGPVVSATATTIAAFLPLILIPGIMGQFMRIIPIAVTLALLASMVEAFIILPSHFADWPGRKIQRRKDHGWLIQLRQSYEHALRYVVRRRKRFVALMFVMFLGAVMLIPLLGMNLYAGEEVNGFQVRVKMPTGTNLDTTEATLREFERAIATLPKEEIRSANATAGLVMTDTDWVFRTDMAQIWLDLPMSYDRKRSTDDIMKDLRQRLLRISGPVSIELAKINTGPPVGKPVEVKVKGKYLDQLEQAVEYVKEQLASVEGVVDVGTDFLAGKEEVRIQVNPDRAALHGLSKGQVGLMIRAAVDGVKAGKMYDGDEEMEIVVRVDQDFFDRPEALLRLPLLLPSGEQLLLGDVASYTTKTTIAEIRRYKVQRAITVFANIDKQKTDSVAVNKQLIAKTADLGRRFAGITLDFTGEWQEFQEAFRSLGQLGLMGLLLIFVILGAQFRSYAQPLVILSTIFFSAIGATVGLLISGNQFSIIAGFGMVALVGVAVNDAIVMVSFINRAKERGLSPEDAVVEGGVLRLRPIILTSATTIAGLLPMAVGLGGMSLTWSPLANVIVWGLAVDTFLTLFMIPAFYLLTVHDIPNSMRRLFRRKAHSS